MYSVRINLQRPGIAWLGALVLLLCVLVSTQSLAAEPIKVGVTLSLSGRYAAPGQAELEGIQMWVHDINARGALLGRPVELVYYDDKSDPATSARLYEKLISEDRVDLLLGPYSSDITMAASAVAEKHNFPMLATGAASSDIWSRGYRNIFGVDAPASSYMDLAVESGAGAGLKRIALVYADSDFTREVGEGARRKAAQHGMEIVIDEMFTGGGGDFDRLAARVRSTDPDMVLGATYLDDSVAFMRAAKRANLSPKAFVFTVGPALQEFGDRLGADAEGVMGVVSWIRSARSPQAQDFSYRYKQKFGQDAGYHAAYGYGAGQVLEAAVRMAGSLDKDAIRQRLGELKFRSLLGHYRVDESGQQTGKQIFVMQWLNGERRLVLPKKLRERPIQYPFEPWSER